MLVALVGIAVCTVIEAVHCRMIFHPKNSDEELDLLNVSEADDQAPGERARRYMANRKVST